MPSEIQVDSNSIQSVLIILITVAIGCYLFYELRKLKQSIENLNKDIHIIKTKLNLNQIPQKNIINPNLVNPNLVNPFMEPKIDSNKNENLMNTIPNENISISQDNEINNRPSLPSDISSNISNDDIDKLMLTDSSDEEDILNRFNI